MDLSLAQIVLTLMVTVAAAMDLASHRIPNWLTYGGIILGLIFGAAYGGWAGLGWSALGFLTGFIPMLLMYMGGGLGAGDVKMMGAVGAMLAFPDALNALIASILVGGFFSFVILLWEGRLWRLLTFYVSNLWSYVWPSHQAEPLPEHKDSFPFGVAIALGTFLTMSSLISGFTTPADLFGG